VPEHDRLARVEIERHRGVRVEERGEHELKGVPDRWRLFTVVEPGASPT
jgi:KaiC/GvpD/RAD55 family RecA-like ATPase